MPYHYIPELGSQQGGHKTIFHIHGHPHVHHGVDDGLHVDGIAEQDLVGVAVEDPADHEEERIHHEAGEEGEQGEREEQPREVARPRRQDARRRGRGSCDEGAYRHWATMAFTRPIASSAAFSADHLSTSILVMALPHTFSA